MILQAMKCVTSFDAIEANKNHAMNAVYWMRLVFKRNQSTLLSCILIKMNKIWNESAPRANQPV